jgi:hypothetical protein
MCRCLSVGFLERKRSKEIERSAKEVTENYQPPGYGTIHFDSKIFAMKGGVKEDRVAIVYSPPPKILSICSILASTEEAQKETCIQAEWKLKPTTPPPPQPVRWLGG